MKRLLHKYAKAKRGTHCLELFATAPVITEEEGFLSSKRYLPPRLFTEPNRTARAQNGQGIAFCVDAVLDLPKSTRRQTLK
jgi:hypothetical protein